MTRLLSLLILFALTLAVPAYSQVCPSGAERDLDTGQCLPIATVTPLLPRPDTPQPPSLLELRQQQSPQIPQPEPSTNTGAESSTKPVPGGIGGGTEYLQGKLQAINGAELDTTMFVQPNGLQETTAGLTWFFNTATNRTQNTVEIVAIYYQQATTGSLGIFDWSCSSDYPCSSPNGNTETQPAWIVTTDFADLTCNITTMKDPLGNTVQAMKYINRTVKISRKGPTWRNVVLLRNFCSGRWDQIWQHQYKGVLTDCSLTNECAWWGPINETFVDGDPTPEIAEVGFMHTTLIHDGITSHLPASETFFSGVPSPWNLLWLDPNQGYAAGNFTVNTRHH